MKMYHNNRQDKPSTLKMIIILIVGLAALGGILNYIVFPLLSLAASLIWPLLGLVALIYLLQLLFRYR